MKKVLVLEVWADENMEDNRECVNEVIGSAMGHEYCCDGTVKIEIIKNLYKEEELDNTYIEDIKLTDEQMNIITNKFEITEWGWHGDGCNCGEFQIEVKGVGFLVVDRSCRKSSSTPEGMQYSFGNIISVYNKSILDPKYNEPYMHDDFEEQGIVCIGDINAKQTQIILEYAKENTIRDLGYDEYGNEIKEGDIDE